MKTSLLYFPYLLVALVTFSGCGSKTSKAVGSCLLEMGTDKEKKLSCVDYLGADFTVEAVTAGCLASADLNAGIITTYSAEACKTTDVVGKCRKDGGTAREQRVNYYSPSFDNSTALANCTSTAAGWFWYGE